MKVVEKEFGDLAINVGPQHPATHGVFRMRIFLEGERIVKVEPHIGYLHRGVEKLCELESWDMIPPVLERNDYLSPTSNSLAYCLAVEELAQIEVPKRAQYLRVIVAELQRVSSHLLWLGTWGLDLGGAFGGGTTLFLWCFEDREKILNFMEKLTGTRFHTNFNQIGGVRYDVWSGFDREVFRLCDTLEKDIKNYFDILSENKVFLERTRGVGKIPQDLAKRCGCSGPVARGSGINFDVRRKFPYSSYDEFDFEVPTESDGDCFARFRVRMREMLESLKIVRQAVEGLPEGKIFARKPIKSPTAFRVPAGWTYKAVESPRGELGIFVVSDGKNKPYRLKIRSPSFSNLSVIPHIMPGHLFADAVAILGSLDPVFGDVDR